MEGKTSFSFFFLFSFVFHDEWYYFPRLKFVQYLDLLFGECRSKKKRRKSWNLPNLKSCQCTSYWVSELCYIWETLAILFTRGYCAETTHTHTRICLSIALFLYKVYSSNREFHKLDKNGHIRDIILLYVAKLSPPTLGEKIIRLRFRDGIIKWNRWDVVRVNVYFFQSSIDLFLLISFKRNKQWKWRGSR